MCLIIEYGHLDIQYLKKIGLVVAENNGQSIGCNDKKYFLNESTKYIYYLLELEGETRMRKLNINRTHYRNKEAAKRWYYDIVRKICASALFTRRLKNVIAHCRTCRQSARAVQGGTN